MHLTVKVVKEFNKFQWNHKLQPHPECRLERVEFAAEVQPLLRFHDQQPASRPIAASDDLNELEIIKVL